MTPYPWNVMYQINGDIKQQQEKRTIDILQIVLLN